MKPLKIEFQAFGPYKGHEIVDFDAISSKGLFLICGKTGIGKTMILDAMTFALYGKSSGHGRDDFEAMRCTNADFDKMTFVKFTFENQGEYYLFERRLERKRTKLSPSYNVMKKGADNVWRPLLENAKDKELNKLAVDIIGLEYDQFRQVIVLPQGQFEKLLTSNSDEKEKILTSIFGEEKWQIIAEKMYEEASGRKEELERIKRQIITSLSDEDCESMQDLALCIKHKQDEMKEAEKEYKKANYDKQTEALQKQLMLVNSFKDLHNVEETIEELDEEKEDRDSWETTLQWGAKADKVRKYLDTFDGSYEDVENRDNAEKAAIKEKERQENLYKKAEEDYNRLVRQEKEIEEKKKRKIQYEGKVTDYEGIESISDELDAAKREQGELIKQVNNAQKKYDKFGPEIAELKKQYDNLTTEHSELLEIYLAGITGELASQLEKGKPCPVCGSLEHPKKAKLSDNSVSKETVDNKKDEADGIYERMNDSIKAQEDAKKVLDRAKEAQTKANSIIIEKEAKLQSMQKNMVKGIATIQDLKKAIRLLERDINTYTEAKDLAEKRKTDLSKAFTTAESNLKTASAEKKKAETKYKKAEEALIQALEENEFEDSDQAREFLLTQEEVQDYKEAIATHDANRKNAEKHLKDLKKQLKDMEEPDEDECKAGLESITDQIAAYESKKATLGNEIVRLTKKEESLKKASEGLDEKLRVASEDVIFAKKIRGDSGTGIQRYVLGIMFSSVIAAANKMLEMVHGGRYRLFRSDDKAQGSNKRGLDLKVYDSHSEDSEGRFVSTLSGGEKFLASLALSIGMSTIAQKSGIKIEALFIDEGFGSLDEDSIGDAMSILGSIQEANGLVGIISHVQILQDRIPTKLIVEQKGNGSHITQSIG